MCYRKKVKTNRINFFVAILLFFVLAALIYKPFTRSRQILIYPLDALLECHPLPTDWYMFSNLDKNKKYNANDCIKPSIFEAFDWGNLFLFIISIVAIDLLSIALFYKLQSIVYKIRFQR